MEMAASESGKPPGNSRPRVNSIFRWLRKIVGLKRKTDLTSEEREKQIEESIERFASQVSSEDNVLEKDEREMIHGVLELGGTAVKEIMVPRINVIGIAIGTAFHEVINIIKRSGHSRLPLYDNSLDDIKGIIYAKDLLSHALNRTDLDLVTVARKTYFIPENLKIDNLLRELKRRRLHIAVVVDEYGGTSGLVTMEDIIEEIVGEIEDEYDTEPPPIIELSAGSYMVEGPVTISDLNEQLDLKIPEKKFETVGGLIYDLVGSLPEKGQIVKYDNIKFVVHKVEGQRIVKVKLTVEKQGNDDVV